MDTPTAAASSPTSSAPIGAGAGTSAATTASTASTAAGSGPGTPTHVTDGQQGAGALSSEQSVDAMLAAFAAKGGEQPTTQSAAATTETPAATQTSSIEATDGTTAEGDATTSPEAAAQTTEDDGYSFDEDASTGARDLAQAIDSNEALKAALPPELRDQIMANARIAERNAGFSELFGSVDEAKVVVQSASDFARVNEAFTSIQGENVAKGASALVNLMLEMSALRDENGNVRKDANGRTLTDGTTGRFLNEMFDRRMAAIEQKIKASGDDSAIAAFDQVMESAGLRPSTAAKTDSDPAIAERQRQLDAQQAEINRQRAAGEQEKRTQYETALNGELETLTTGEFDKLLKQASGLDGLTKSAVTAKLTKAIKAAVRSNPAYRAEKDRLELQPMSDARRKAEVALAARFYRDNLVRIAKPILAEAGITVGKKQAARAEAQAARGQSTRSEVTGATPRQATQPVNAAKDPAAARAPFVEALKAKLGRMPSDSEITQEMMLAAVSGRRSA